MRVRACVCDCVFACACVCVCASEKQRENCFSITIFITREGMICHLMLSKMDYCFAQMIVPLFLFCFDNCRSFALLDTARGLITCKDLSCLNIQLPV